MKREKVVDVGLDGAIPYVAMDPTPGGENLGRAEFEFCPIWKRGRMVELLVFPAQQRTDVLCYRLALTGRVRTFSFTHRSASPRREEARPWMMTWCQEHKTVSYRVYVPAYTNELRFEPHFGTSIDVVFASRSK